MSQETAFPIFGVDDYRIYVRAWVKAQGRGEYRKISQALRMHTTLVSQVFAGKKCLTEEQASLLCQHMGLNPLESDCFLKRNHPAPMKNIFNFAK